MKYSTPKSTLLTTTTNPFIGAIAFLLISSFFSCDKLFDSDYCPSCNEDVHWSGYGKLKFSNSGFDGSIGGIHLQQTCNWKIFNGNAGGYGHIYQVSSCNDGVIFTWAYGKLNSVSLTNGWLGSTKEGVRIGDDLTKFLTVYPLSQRSTYNTSLYSFKNVSASFSQDNKLVRLVILNK